MDNQGNLSRIDDWTIGDFYMNNQTGDLYKCTDVSSGRNHIHTYRPAFVHVLRLRDNRAFKMERIQWHRKFKHQRKVIP